MEVDAAPTLPAKQYPSSYVGLTAVCLQVERFLADAIKKVQKSMLWKINGQYGKLFDFCSALPSSILFNL